MILLTGIFAIACDPCANVNGNGDNFENRIFFSAPPANGLKPAIYAISTDGTDLDQIVADGQIFSPPSDNHKIAFLRKDSATQKILLLLAEHTGENEVEIDREKSLYSIAYPVISPNGEFIAFNGGQGQLLSVRSDGTGFVDFLSGNLMEETSYSFSPDSKYICYFEKIASDSQFQLKVINIESPESVSYTRNFDNSSLPDFGPLKVDWSNEGEFIAYSIINDSISTIYIDYMNGDYSEIRLYDFFASMPVISNDNKHLAFSSSDGVIWIRNIADDNVVFSRITDDNSTTYNVNPIWSPDKKSIIYEVFYNNSYNSLSTLYLSELYFQEDHAETIASNILVNNIISAFWNN